MKSYIRNFLGTLIALLGLSVMIGWFTHNYHLTQILPEFVPMYFNAALCFLLSGIAIIGTKKWGKISGCLGIVVFLVGLLTLFEYIFAINIGLDQFFVKSIINIKTSHPGRMAPNTALCFLFTGSMLALTGFFKISRWSSFNALLLNSLVGLLGFLAFMSYILGIEAIYAWGNLTAMAVHTALGFIMISLGSFPLLWDRSSKYQLIESYFLVIFVAACSLVLLLMFWLVSVSYRDNLLKQSIEREAVYGQAEITNLLLIRLESLGRLFYRGEYHDNYKTEFWKNDVNTYFPNFPTLKIVAAEKSLNSPLVFARNAIAQQSAKNDLQMCHQLMKAPLKNLNSTDSNLQLFMNEELLCVTNTSHTMIAIFDIKKLFNLVFNMPVWESYGIELSNSGKNVFKKNLKVDPSFKEQWNTVKQFSLFGNEWNLEIWLNKKTLNDKSSLTPLFFLLFGLVVTALLAIIVRLWQISRIKNKFLAQYHILIESIDEGICIIEMIFNEHQKAVDYRFLQVNTAFEKQSGLKDVLGKRMLEVVPLIEKEWFDIFGQVALTGQFTRFENYAEPLNRWFDVYAFRYGEAKNQQVALLFNNITKEKIAEKKLKSTIEDLERTKKSLDFTAHHDHLTGLSNRVLLEEISKKSIAGAIRHKKNIAFLMIDLDKFKNVNDILGHEAGDLLLKEMTKRFLSTLRDVDTLARLGGDEFAVITDYIEKPEEASIIAKKIIAEARKPFYCDENEIIISASIGIAIYPLDGTNLSMLMKNADIALYQAKDRGRNTFSWSTVPAAPSLPFSSK